MTRKRERIPSKNTDIKRERMNKREREREREK
jgi:hypothetical protein